MAPGRKVLEAYVTALSGGSGFDTQSVPGVSSSDLSAEEPANWAAMGGEAFKGEDGEEVRLKVVEGVLEGSVQAGWSDEQVVVLRSLFSHLLQKDEDWLGAARALAKIPLDSTSR